MPTRMEFGLLGPLTVRKDGILVPVPQGNQRALLAALLLNAGAVVSIDDLAGTLWGNAPPPSARVTVQNYVKRLRQVLPDGGGSRITTHPHGYSISVDAGELDVTRFAAFLATSREAARNGSWDAAAAAARTALSLWRGEPLADVDTELLAAREVPRLTEMRLQALETRIDAELHMGQAAELIAELRQLAAAHPLREHLHAQLMLALYRDSRQAEALAAYREVRDILVTELGAEPGPELRDLHQRILAADSGLVIPVAPAAAQAADSAARQGSSPYLGLNPFGERDAERFFGREAAAAQVLDLMSAQLASAGLVVVSGVSGAGKSSLLRAGVLARVRGAGLAAVPEAASWPTLVFTPGRAPLEELAVRIAPIAGADAAAVCRQLAADPAGFALTARQAALAAAPDSDVTGSTASDQPGTGHRRVLLVVDQCEQLFTLCEQQAQREAFVAALHAAATSTPHPAALVVLVVRADFEARLADYPELSAAVQNRYLLTSMTGRQLRLAISKPAEVFGSRVDDDLIQVLLDEVRARAGGTSGGHAGAGVLPLLSHALDQAWRNRAGQTLTLVDYERTGGIEGAVGTSAQRAYHRLTPAQQEAARQVFTRLTATSEDGTDTAARAARAELTAGNDTRAADVAAVLETFAAERLLTLDADSVELSHEALLTAWPLLRDTWLADARTDRIVRTRLHASATEWMLASRDPAYLYRGSRLEVAAATAARIEANARHTPLSQAERDFLHASRRARRRGTRARRQLTAILLASAAALVSVWIVAVRAERAAASQHDIAVSRLLINESEALGAANATVSQVESIAAWTLDSSPQSRYAMLAAAANPEIATVSAEAGGVDSLAVSPDGKIFATGTASGAVRLWDLATGQQTGIPFGAGSVLGFSDGGKTLVTYDNAAQLWDVATGRRIGRPFATSTPTAFAQAALSPDGKVLAIASVGGGAQLWDVATGRPAGRPLGAGNGYGLLAFSPDGEALATTIGAGAVEVWDLATGQSRSISAGNQVDSAAFSPDGRTLATGDIDGTVRLWDVATGRPIGGPLSAGNSDLNAMAFSPDGSLLAAGSADGTVRLWNAVTGEQMESSFAGGGGVNVIAFSPDGRTLLTGNQDGTARLWDVAAATSRQIGTSAGLASQSAWVAFSPGGKTLVAYTNAARLWDVATGREIGEPFAANADEAGVEVLLPDGQSFTTSAGPIDAVALSPDGRTLATGADLPNGALPVAPGGTTPPAVTDNGDSGTVQLWDVATGREIGRPLAVTGGGADWVVFGPAGKTVAAVNLAVNRHGTGTAQLWNVATGRQIGTLLPVASSDAADPVAFTPDGTMLALDGDSGPVQRWDVTTGRQVGRPFAASSEPITWLALSPGGDTLATGGQDGVAQLWDVTTGQLIGSMSGMTGVDSAAFSPDGEVLATINGDSGTVRLWDVTTGQQIGGQLGGTGSAAVAFSPDGKTVAVASEYGTVQLWNVSYLTDPLAQLCARVGGSITRPEWAQYVPAGLTYRNACP